MSDAKPGYNAPYHGRGIWYVLAFGVLVWLSLSVYDRVNHRKVEPRIVTARGELASDEQTTIDIFQRTSPSVVYITTTARVRDPWRRSVFDVPAGTGSGFIWDDKGHVVTNFHVIKDASSATIRLNDDRVFNAELIGVSAEHDLAVMRISTPFPIPSPVPLGASQDLQVGQKVFAIGNPFGLDYTLTSGIISALNRSINADERRSIDNLIQTDAAINPGNSGGPLLDSAGRLIGINTAIFSPSGASAGIGFAVPVDAVNIVVPRLISEGRYTPPKIGIQTDPQINQQITQRLKIEGVVVLGINPGSIAEKLQLQSANYDNRQGFILGDIIVAINGNPIKSSNDIATALERHSSADPLVVEVWRDGKVVKLQTDY